MYFPNKDGKILTVYFNGLIAISMLIIAGLFMYIDYQGTQLMNVSSMVEDDSKKLFGSYNQISEYEINKQYSMVFKSFCRYEPNIIGVHSYDYSFSTSRDMKNLVVNLKYVNGYIDPNKDVNAIIQSQYILNKKVLRTFKRSFHAGRYHNNLVEVMITCLGSVSKDIIKGLNEPIGKDDIVLFGSIFDYLQRNLIGNIDKLRGLIDLFPYSKKRINILKAIVLAEFLDDSTVGITEYKGDANDKLNRSYCIKIATTKEGKHRLFLIIIEGTVDYKIITQKFHKLLSSEDLNIEKEAV